MTPHFMAFGTHPYKVLTAAESDKTAPSTLANSGPAREDNTYDELDTAAPGSNTHLIAAPQTNTYDLGAPDGNFSAEDAGRDDAHYTNVVDGDDGTYMLTPTAASLPTAVHYAI